VYASQVTFGRVMLLVVDRGEPAQDLWRRRRLWKISRYAKSRWRARRGCSTARGPRVGSASDGPTTGVRSRRHAMGAKSMRVIKRQERQERQEAGLRSNILPKLPRVLQTLQ
jgi:hypothetical protein